MRYVSSLEGIIRSEECVSQVPWCPHSLEDTTSMTDVDHPDELELMAETVEAGMKGVENHMLIIVNYCLSFGTTPHPGCQSPPGL